MLRSLIHGAALHAKHNLARHCWQIAITLDQSIMPQPPNQPPVS